MSKYNEYARRLDEAFKEAREGFSMVYDYTVQKTNEYKEADREHKIKHSPETLRNATNKRVAYEEAQEYYKLMAMKNWDIFFEKKEKITREFMEEIEKDYVVNPADIDKDTMTLINTGIVKPNEIPHLAERFRDNLTMLRVIGKLACEMSGQVDISNDQGVKLKTKLEIISKSIDTAKENKIDAWNTLLYIADTCTGYDQRNMGGQTIKNFNANWERATANVENF